MSLIDDLIEGGWLKDDRIISAFTKIKRVDFMTPGMEDLSQLNEALPIGYGQTISQPLVVAFMIELLEPKEGEKILDVGSGSGWTTALLAELVGERGKVVAVEIIPELKTFGENNVGKYDFIKRGIAQFICGDGSKGCEKQAPFDKILASASIQSSSRSEEWRRTNVLRAPERSEGERRTNVLRAVKNEIPNPGKEDKSSSSPFAGAREGKEIPPAWKDQLKIGGRIVAPIDSSIWLFIKKSETEFEKTEYPGFVFVPFVEK